MLITFKKLIVYVILVLTIGTSCRELLFMAVIVDPETHFDVRLLTLRTPKLSRQSLLKGF